MDSASCIATATTHIDGVHTNDNANHGAASALTVSRNGSKGSTQNDRLSHATVIEITDQFALPLTELQKITDHFSVELQRGLRDASLPFQLPAFVTVIPTGSETGNFLSVDLGGTNCRICLVHLRGNGEYSVTQAKHTVPQNVMVNEQFEPLFHWLAARIGDFVAEHIPTPTNHNKTDMPSPERTPLGFTFSFTCDQTSLSSGTLIHWDKGWDIPAAIGRDPCRLLQDAMDAANVLVEVVVLANDSVGTLLARAYTAASTTNGTGGIPSKTLASVIVGTGTNAAYVEQLSRIVRHSQSSQENASQAVMVMNSEWGCLDDTLIVLPNTRFDTEIDANSSNPGGQMFEKMASGMYLGELFRLAVRELVQRGDVLDFTATGQDVPLFCRDSLDTALLSSLVDENKLPDDKTALVSSGLGVQGVSAGDLVILQTIAGAITTRAARLTGAALAAILIQCGYGITASNADDSKNPAGAKITPAPAAPIGCREVTRNSKIGKKAKVKRFVTLCAFWIRDMVSGCMPFKSSSGREDTLLAKPSRETSTSISREATGAGSITQGDMTAVEIIDIGITGSVIELHPSFESEMLSAMREIPAIGLDGQRKIRTGLCKDGSAVGAALMAHAALCQNKQELA